jgi:asparagine synthase (glutamine-hydrolysing)
LTKWLHRQAMRDLLPDLVLKRTTKADFMVVFRRQLAGLKPELVNEIVPRRLSWLQPDRAVEICEHSHEVTFAGWSEWWLWSLIGCDALP